MPNLFTYQIRINLSTKKRHPTLLMFRRFCGKKYCSGSSAAGSSKDSSDYIEGIVCHSRDLKENDMKIVTLKGSEVLLVKQKGEIHALGPTCTHYGAPLVEGALGDGRIRCKLHGACFNLTTGDIEDFPGMDSLPCHKVTVKNGRVRVRAKKEELLSKKRVKEMVRRAPSVKERFVIVGGGPSGATAAEVLRQEGFTGQITLIVKEDTLPYDRVKITKQMDFNISDVRFRTEQFYEDYGIDIIMEVEATALDTKNKTISLSNSTVIQYDKLYIATGGDPRKVPCPGGTALNVCYLNTYHDAEYVYPRLTPDTEVVIIGSGFIAMEAASYIVDKVKSVTVIARGEVPFKVIWSMEIGAAILKYFRSRGVNYVSNSGVTQINATEDGTVSSVVLRDGTVLNCTLILCGIGSQCATEFLKGSGLNLRPDGSIEVNEYLEANVPDVYVGGIVAYAPNWSHNNDKEAIGHFGVAQYHGRMAALQMVGKPTPLKTVPIFWSVMFRKKITYAGTGKYDDVIPVGDLDTWEFVAFYLNRDEVVAVLECGMDPLASIFAERLAQGKKLYRKDLKDDPLAWSK